MGHGGRMVDAGNGSRGHGCMVSKMVKVEVGKATVFGHSIDETHFSGSMKLHANRRPSGSNHRSWCHTSQEKPRALIPNDAT